MEIVKKIDTNSDKQLSPGKYMIIFRNIININ